MATYYVSNAGSNSNDGLSEGASWQTLAYVRTYALSPGDVVLLKRGDTWAETLDIRLVAGTRDAPITFGAYGAGAPPLLGGTVLGIHIQAPTAIVPEWIIVQDMDVVTTYSEGCTVADACAHIVIRRVRSSGAGNDAFKQYATSEVSWYDIEGWGAGDDGFSQHDSSVAIIKGGYFHDCGTALNNVWSARLTMRNCVLADCSEYGLKLSEVGLGAGAVTEAYGCTIKDCVDNVHLDGDQALHMVGCTILDGATQNVWAHEQARLGLQGCRLDGAPHAVQIDDNAQVAIARCSLVRGTTDAVAISGGEVTVIDSRLRGSTASIAVTGSPTVNVVNSDLDPAYP
jgi:hypothetical protein